MDSNRESPYNTLFVNGLVGLALEMVVISVVWLAIFSMIFHPLTCLLLRTLQGVCGTLRWETRVAACGTLILTDCLSEGCILFASLLTAVLPFFLSRLFSGLD